MTERTIRLTVNRKQVTAKVEPRLGLADFLREHLLLTGTHLGCEHGICGACTVHIDGAPARSCITYAVSCDGAEVTTIEGFDEDPVMAALRAAFSREHGLQCGYCTPGMLASARDIVRRLPDADERRIRVELSGNLCRCTGYVGIVRAVRSVIEERRQGRLVVPDEAPAPLGPLGSARGTPLPFGEREGEGATATVASPHKPVAGPLTPALSPEGRGGEARLGGELARPGVTLRQAFAVQQPRDKVWDFFRDVAAVATCMPGVALTAPVQDNRIEGRLRLKLGPIAAAFAGHAEVTRDEAGYRGTIRGAGGDAGSGSRVRGEVAYALVESDAGATRVELDVGFTLAGPLAQFGRSALVQDLAGRLSAEFARNLEARMAGGGGAAAPAEAAELRAGGLLLAVLWSRLKHGLARLLGRG